MSIKDLTTMGESQVAVKNEIRQRMDKLGEELPDFCFQCGKCTSGCEAHKLLELEPHRIVALLKKGLIDEMINSDLIWTCMSCFKCRERCPQRVAPVDILFSLKNLSVLQGKQIPGKFTGMLQSILSMGMIQGIQEVTTDDNQTVSRDDLGLPSLTNPDSTSFQIQQIAIEKI
jgi:heterodisulfide reductase subunit C